MLSAIAFLLLCEADVHSGLFKARAGWLLMLSAGLQRWITVTSSANNAELKFSALFLAHKWPLSSLFP